MLASAAVAGQPVLRRPPIRVDSSRQLVIGALHFNGPQIDGRRAIEPVHLRQRLGIVHNALDCVQAVRLQRVKGLTKATWQLLGQRQQLLLLLKRLVPIERLHQLARL